MHSTLGKALFLASLLAVSGCGKIAAAVAKAAAHEADNAAVAAAKSGSHEAADAGVMAAARHSDDAIHGPAPIDDAAENGATQENPLYGVGRTIVENARDEAIQNGIESAISNDDKR